MGLGVKVKVCTLNMEGHVIVLEKREKNKIF